MNHTVKYFPKPDTDLNVYLPDVDIIFEGRNSVTEYEMFRYLSDKLFLIGNRNDINLIEAYFKFLDDIQIDEQVTDTLKGIAGIIRIFILKKYFEKQSA